MTVARACEVLHSLAWRRTILCEQADKPTDRSSRERSDMRDRATSRTPLSSAPIRRSDVPSISRPGSSRAPSRSSPVRGSRHLTPFRTSSSYGATTKKQDAPLRGQRRDPDIREKHADATPQPSSLHPIDRRPGRQHRRRRPHRRGLRRGRRRRDDRSASPSSAGRSTTSSRPTASIGISPVRSICRRPAASRPGPISPPSAPACQKMADIGPAFESTAKRREATAQGRRGGRQCGDGA